MIVSNLNRLPGAPQKSLSHGFAVRYVDSHRSCGVLALESR
ncbi:hypothetical protein APY04_1929 [Hyphomicrobium sulfonivorans]|uniref:Uncharacterized protein n=1 Tax=Hyphomicrobium sulfonivorans TaxID=121290 RepID=A0A125NUQ5_HYPSL|nr:hypothetical protein APY04_1929 [Hyphomicrobium sulfonivorans]